MEFHKLAHKLFLFCMFLVCALAVISFAREKVQASLSANSTNSVPPTSFQVESSPTDSAISSAPVSIAAANTTTAVSENTVTSTNISSPTIKSQPDSTASKTTVVPAVKNTATATSLSPTTNVTQDTQKQIDDVETMRRLLLTNTENSSTETKPQVQQAVGDVINNDAEVEKKEEVKALEKNDDPTSSLTGQIFTQPTVIFASDLQKENNPKLSGNSTNDLSVGNVELINKYDGQKSLLFKGKALPGSSFNIFIFSKDPVVMTVKADENGNWSYELTKDVADGQHEVYIAVTEKSGRIVSKAEPFAFVKTAEAATSIPVSELDEYKSPMQKSTASYVLMAITIMSVCLAIALALIGILNHKHKADETII